MSFNAITGVAAKLGLSGNSKWTFNSMLWRRSYGRARRYQRDRVVRLPGAVWIVTAQN